jgi:hypothetical protein
MEGQGETKLRFYRGLGAFSAGCIFIRGAAEGAVPLPLRFVWNADISRCLRIIPIMRTCVVNHRL